MHIESFLSQPAIGRFLPPSCVEPWEDQCWSYLVAGRNAAQKKFEDILIICRQATCPSSMVISVFRGRGVGFGFGAGCGFGVGWGFGGSSLQTLGLGAGGGCGIGLGLGWGFGLAYGTPYVDSKPAFEGFDFRKLAAIAGKDGPPEIVKRLKDREEVLD